MKYSLFLFIVFCLFSCSEKKSTETSTLTDSINSKVTNTSIVVLGTIQDAGYPQIGCTKDCCINAFDNPKVDKKVVSLGLIDTKNDKTYLFDATPDIGSQMKTLTKLETINEKELVDGIFITHAHIGHYTGLMFLGKEAINSNKVPLFVMPKMKEFLTNNGPWSQLVENQNVAINSLKDEKTVQLSEDIEVTPFLVPHRDEFSETVGYKIKGPNKSALFIPDIDKWEKWEKSIVEEIKQVDYAFVDATFYSGIEMNNRDISEIPHPFVVESFQKFENLNKEEKNKIIFIHFNHTNPIIHSKSKETQLVIEQGYRIARKNDIYEL